MVSFVHFNIYLYMYYHFYVREYQWHAQIFVMEWKPLP